MNGETQGVVHTRGNTYCIPVEKHPKPLKVQECSNGTFKFEGNFEIVFFSDIEKLMEHAVKHDFHGQDPKALAVRYHREKKPWPPQGK